MRPTSNKARAGASASAAQIAMGFSIEEGRLRRVSAQQPNSGLLLPNSDYRKFPRLDDMAAASIYVMKRDTTLYTAHIQPIHSHINAGNGSDLTIRQTAGLAAKVASFFKEANEFDATKSDGASRKLMDRCRPETLTWKVRTNLEICLQHSHVNFVSK